MTTPFRTEDREKAIDADVMAKAREYAMSAVPGMCTTWRHDYGLMPKAQAEALRRSMEQIAYHDVSLAIARAIQAAKDDGWQPIETCPYRDDTDIFAWDGHWFDVVRFGWFDGDRPVWFNGDVPFDAIAWRPLPNPPQRFTPEEITKNLNERHEAGERA